MVVGENHRFIEGLITVNHEGIPDPGNETTTVTKSNDGTTLGDAASPGLHCRAHDNPIRHNAQPSGTNRSTTRSVFYIHSLNV